MEIGAPSENLDIRKETVEINENNLENFELYGIKSLYGNNSRTRFYGVNQLNKPGDIKTFINENPNGGFEYKNIRYSFDKIFSSSENEIKILCYCKFLGDECDTHTRRLGEAEITIKIKEKELSDKTDGLLNNVLNYIKKIIPSYNDSNSNSISEEGDNKGEIDLLINNDIISSEKVLEIGLENIYKMTPDKITIIGYLLSDDYIADIGVEKLVQMSLEELNIEARKNNPILTLKYGL